MKKVIYLLSLITVMFGCKNNSEPQQEETAVAETESMVKYQSFGESITDQEVISQEEMLLKYDQMKVGDTVSVKFTSKVKSVCQSKGCWMRLDLGANESFVKFKDYGFFMPKDIAGQEVIVEGRAFVEETSVDDLKHFAKDAGKAQQEIDAITEPELTYAFISSGVLIPEKQ